MIQATGIAFCDESNVSREHNVFCVSQKKKVKVKRSRQANKNSDL